MRRNRFGSSPNITTSDCLPRKTTIEGIQALVSKVAEMPSHVILRYGKFYAPVHGDTLKFIAI